MLDEKKKSYYNGLGIKIWLKILPIKLLWEFLFQQYPDKIFTFPPLFPTYFWSFIYVQHYQKWSESFDIKTFVNYKKEQVDANITAIDSPYILRWNINILIFKRKINFMTWNIYWILHSFSKIVQLNFIMKVIIHLHNFPSCPTYDKKNGI